MKTNPREVLFSELTGHHGKVGIITLNRPDQLNALSYDMCKAIYLQLHDWQHQATIKAVIICGTGERAFCAGGDIRTMYYQQNELSSAFDFFQNEYRLNWAIYHFPKPYIALLDGLTMGGGAGVSVHGSYRVATEKFRFAMPETGIGFFPDVGGTYFLPRCTGRSGWYLGLTGDIIGSDDAKFAGLIDKTIPRAQIPALLSELNTTNWKDDPHQTVQAILANFVDTSADFSILATHQTCINHCFSAPTLEAILHRLHREDSEFSARTGQLLNSRSPTSLKVTYEALCKGEQLDFDNCMRMEYRLARRFLQSHDFFEGVRAQVIDKDRSPHWQPDNLAAVDPHMVSAYFQPLSPEDELQLSTNSCT